jgi:hypothetical protein
LLNHKAVTSCPLFGGVVWIPLVICYLTSSCYIYNVNPRLINHGLLIRGVLHK